MFLPWVSNLVPPRTLRCPTKCLPRKDLLGAPVQQSPLTVRGGGLNYSPTVNTKKWQFSYKMIEVAVSQIMIIWIPSYPFPTHPLRARRRRRRENLLPTQRWLDPEGIQVLMVAVSQQKLIENLWGGSFSTLYFKVALWLARFQGVSSHGLYKSNELLLVIIALRTTPRRDFAPCRAAKAAFPALRFIPPPRGSQRDNHEE